MSTVTSRPSALETPNKPKPATVSHSAGVMRQTQAFIGVVVLVGLALGYLVHEAFLVLPAIIGAGLVFAGSSGMCPMASLIGTMPWNRGASASCNGASECCGSCHN
ncbi:MAG: DUF2892 domain-containing protein [Phycisphaerales bacterium]|nr:MAG: DUF2892 domain-containing protein [Phycisphaerales bacterium]